MGTLITKTVEETFNKTNNQQMKKTITLLSLLFIVATSFAQIPTNGLVAWYPFTGSAIDSSGNGNNGTVDGATLTTDRFGNTNSAYSFNGLNSSISVPNSNTLNPLALTISCWYLANELPNGSDGMTVLQKNNIENASQVSYGIIHQNHWNNYIGLYTSTGSGNCGGTNSNLHWGTGYIIPANIWVNVIYSIDSKGNSNVYYNGKLVDSYAGSPLISCNSISSNLRIGGPHWNGDVTLFSGKIDDIRIYNRALNITEVQSLYNEGGYSTLPVKLTNIEATNSNGIVAINWLTSNEINSSHFNIQHSTDGSFFTTIGTVKATVSGANGYNFTDIHPTNGTNYYRLESVDKDGAVAYSRVVSCEWFEVTKQLSVYPNPTKSFVTISGIHIYSVQVVDNLGRVVNTQTLKDATNPTLSVGSLPSGFYHLRIQTTDGKIIGVGFVKQ